MAVVMYMEWDGVTPEQYDAVCDAVGFEDDPAPGGLVHTPWFADGGLRVIDVWETPEDFQRFVDERLMPGVQEVGIQGEPRVQINPLHRRVFAPGIQQVTA